MHTKSNILLVGTGYWSNVIRQLLPKDISWYSSRPSGGGIINLEALGKHLERASRPLLIFLPVGPPHHFEVLDIILQMSRWRNKIWIEKPVFCAFDRYENEIMAKAFADHDIFVDYPYLKHNLVAGAQELRSIHVDSEIDLFLFSKRLYNRPHSEFLDFSPHLFSIISLFFDEDEMISTSVVGWNRDSFRSKTQNAWFVIGDARIGFCFGQSEKRSCLRLVSRQISHTYDLQELFPSPVTANLNMFRTMPAEEWPTFARSLSFSELIRDQSIRLENTANLFFT